MRRLSLSRLATTGLIGNGYLFSDCALPLTYLSLHSVKHLELQVASLEMEVDRMSHSLDSQKAVTATVEYNGRKATEEHTREASIAVCSVRL